MSGHILYESSPHCHSLTGNLLTLKLNVMYPCGNKLFWIELKIDSIMASLPKWDIPAYSWTDVMTTVLKLAETFPTITHWSEWSSISSPISGLFHADTWKPLWKIKVPGCRYSSSVQFILICPSLGSSTKCGVVTSILHSQAYFYNSHDLYEWHQNSVFRGLVPPSHWFSFNMIHTVQLLPDLIPWSAKW